MVARIELAVSGPVAGGLALSALPAKAETAAPMPVRAGVANNNGMTVLSEDANVKYFAKGLPVEKAKVLRATQQPTAAATFGGKTAAAGAAK